MSAILIAFDKQTDAFAFVSEIRRRADTMLWEVHVRRQDGHAVVVVPEVTWRRDRFVRGVALRYGGFIREDDRTGDRCHPLD